MIGLIRRFSFRAAKNLYRRFERRAEERWSPQDRIAFARFMLLIKRRMFPNLGLNSLSARIDQEVCVSSKVNSDLSLVAVDRPIGAMKADPYPAAHIPVDLAPVKLNGRSDAFYDSLRTRAAPSSQNPTWLWFEQQQLNKITRHTRLPEADWSRLAEVSHGDGIIIRTETRHQFSTLGEGRVLHVLLLPWLRRGGADKAALAYLAALQEEMPGRVLAIFTEPVDSPWGHLVPAGVERIEWHKLADWGSIEASSRNLAWLLIQLCPQTIHVMNSYLGWELLKRRGALLRAHSNIFASLFWYGPSPGPKIQGYASEYLPSVINILDGVITDNSAFPKKLCRDYGFDPSLFQTVYHPTDFIIDSKFMRSREFDRLTVLWASRFAKEKNMDVLAAIAAERPQYHFLVYGDTDEFSRNVFDAVERLRKLANVEMRGVFDGFSELPISQCDVFLYTSSSDGMPNVLVEAAAHGLPILAPAVGGISELIEGGAGWLINSSSSVCEYLSALDQAVSNEARLLRALAALDRVRARHSVEAFRHSLRAVPAYLRR